MDKEYWVFRDKFEFVCLRQNSKFWGRVLRKSLSFSRQFKIQVCWECVSEIPGSEIWVWWNKKKKKISLTQGSLMKQKTEFFWDTLNILSFPRFENDLKQSSNGKKRTQFYRWHLNTSDLSPTSFPFPQKKQAPPCQRPEPTPRFCRPPFASNLPGHGHKYIGGSGLHTGFKKCNTLQRKIKIKKAFLRKRRTANCELSLSLSLSFKRKNK